MIVKFRKIKQGVHEFKAQEKGIMYQGKVHTGPSGRGSTLASIDSSPALGDKEGIVMTQFVKYRKS
jgi:hypothetical protein